VEPNTWLWILAGFVALVFLGTGLLKLTTPRERLVEAGIGWTEDFSQQTIRLLGLAEVLGAVGLVVPGLIGVLPVRADQRLLPRRADAGCDRRARPPRRVPPRRAPSARPARLLRPPRRLPLRAEPLLTALP